MADLQNQRIRAGDVVVLSRLGAKGGPGVASVSWFAAALAGSPLAGETALITDGQLSGLNHGVIVGQVMPEAAVGDHSRSSPTATGSGLAFPRAVDLLVEAEEFEERLGRLGDPTYRRRDDSLGQYQRLVTPLVRGGVLNDVAS